MSDFNPYAAPDAEITRSGQGTLGEGVWRHGVQVVCTKNAEFPDRCIKCNRSCDGYRLKRTLRWHSPGYFLFFLISPILYLIVALCVWWRATVAFPLCEEHRRSRTKAIVVGWLMAIVGILLMPLGVWLATDRSGEGVGLVALGAGFLLIFGGLVYANLFARSASTVRIDKLYVWLKGASPAFIASLPNFHGPE